MNDSTSTTSDTVKPGIFSSTESTAAKTSLDIINAVYPPLLIIVGVTCNVFIILVMRTKYFRSQSTSVFMTAGAVNDTLSLALSMTTHWLYVTFDGIYYKNNVKSICKFLDFYGWGNCDLGILITTAMTVERAMSITFPLKKLSVNPVRKARIIVAILIFIVIAKEFHFLIGSNMVEDERQERLCDVFPATETYLVFWKHVWPWLHLGFLIICFLTMIGSNIVLVQQVWMSSRRREIRATFATRKTTKMNNGHHSSSSGRTDRQWRSITPMLIGESLVLLILTFPFTIQLSISGYNPEFYQSYEMGLLFSVTFYMLYTNKCVTFFVYLITGARFRLELKRLFCRKKMENTNAHTHTKSRTNGNLPNIATIAETVVSPESRKRINLTEKKDRNEPDDILPYSTSDSSLSYEFTHL